MNEFIIKTKSHNLFFDKMSEEITQMSVFLLA